mgnify:CR=1 FL=1
MFKKIEYDEVEVSEIIDDTKFESYFDGKIMDFIGYKFLRIFLTAITAGIAKPWADVIFYKYMFSHTIYDGKRLAFRGSGEELFVERFKWIFFSIITLGIYLFWIPVKKQKWIVSNLYFEEDDYSRGESFFFGTVLKMLGVNLLTIFLSVISFGLLVPFSICYKRRWLMKYIIISRKKIVFEGKSINLFGKCLLWALLTIVTLGIYGIWVPVKLYDWKAKNTFLKMKLV